MIAGIIIGGIMAALGLATLTGSAEVFYVGSLAGFVAAFWFQLHRTLCEIRDRLPPR